MFESGDVCYSPKTNITLYPGLLKDQTLPSFLPLKIQYLFPSLAIMLLHWRCPSNVTILRQRKEIPLLLIFAAWYGYFSKALICLTMLAGFSFLLLCDFLSSYMLTFLSGIWSTSFHHSSCMILSPLVLSTNSMDSQIHGSSPGLS